MMGKAPRQRVLLIAEACNPEWTSVPLLAYHWYYALRERADVTLVTQIRNRPAFLRKGGVGEKVVFIDNEAIAGPLHKLGKMLTFGHPTALGSRAAVTWVAYLYFEHLVWKWFGRRLACGEFDLVHRLTPLSPTMPSPIAARCPVPFILGPLNGALPWPSGTDSIRAREGEWLTPIRSLYRVLPYWRRTFERSALVIVGARHVLREIPACARKRTTVLAENGVDLDRFHVQWVRSRADTGPFTILFVGRLIPVKQPALLVEALALMRAPKGAVRLRYVGDGPERANIVQTAEKLGVSEQIELLGHVAHQEVARHYETSSVLALPSIHESGGAVLLEGMACGVPCVVIAYGGPAEYVTDDTGIKVGLGTFDEMVAGYAQAFSRLLGDPDLQRRLSIAARQRVEQQYAWSVKAEELVRLYHTVVPRRQGHARGQ